MNFATDLIIDINGYYAGTGVVTSVNALTGGVTLAPGTNVSIIPSGQTLTIASSVPQGPTGPTGPTGPGSGTFDRSIHAITCIPQGGAPSGDTSLCSAGGSVQTEGGNSIPCILRGRATLDTYVCDLALPTGAILQEIVAYGSDVDASGYFEAAVWRTANNTFVPTFLSSSFGGAWQTSGIAFNSGFTSFPIFQTTDTPQAILADSRYTIGLGVKGTTSLFVYGFRVRYSIP